MDKQINSRVCPVEKAQSLDTWYRRWLQNPYKVAQPYVSQGMKVVDFGCGPGYFTLDIARLAGDSGQVFAMDIQQGMLDIVAAKTASADINNLQCVLCSDSAWSALPPIDLIWAFYVVHEVPDPTKLIEQFDRALKPGGGILIAEPAIFGLSASHFKATVTQFIAMNYVVKPVRGLFMAKTYFFEKQA
ncbi:class I SAM-dependent methyltransferase [Pseudoalteromonas rubra]|uniref:class I SAM-dependent methyltransferase n=1 Tax=Pseudoalteromonas rubra TaxID=43658 RepID=UPI000F7AD0DD|nr:class I SAM-dependent methyltransferase [Pseudoalteromonas rubra]